jgi:hypothetical protein
MKEKKVKLQTDITHTKDHTNTSTLGMYAHVSVMMNLLAQSAHLQNKKRYQPSTECMHSKAGEILLRFTVNM